MAVVAASEMATQEAIRDWLYCACKLWRELGWDDEKGGFVESVALNGRPNYFEPRRIRVQFRQLYVFARLSRLFPDLVDDKFLDQALDYVISLADREGPGWPHIIHRDGSALDDKRDTYDHAFALLSLAWLPEKMRDRSVMCIIDDVIFFLTHDLKDDLYGGYKEGRPNVGPKRQNPHMHLLEAYLALYRNTREKRFLDLADPIISLFEATFLDPKNGYIIEYFEDDWTPISPFEGRLFEPGHAYEWIYLLKEYGASRGVNYNDICRRLFRDANAHCEKTFGFAPDYVTADGAFSKRFRLWPQTERLRAMAHPVIAAPEEAAAFAQTILRTYLQTKPYGIWRDSWTRDDGFTIEAAPASTFYHLASAFCFLLENQHA